MKKKMNVGIILCLLIGAYLVYVLADTVLTQRDIKRNGIEATAVVVSHNTERRGGGRQAPQDVWVSRGYFTAVRFSTCNFLLTFKLFHNEKI